MTTENTQKIQIYPGYFFYFFNFTKYIKMNHIVFVKCKLLVNYEAAEFLAKKLT